MPSQYIVVISTTISGTNPIGIPYVHQAHPSALLVHLRIHSFQTFQPIGGRWLYGLTILDLVQYWIYGGKGSKGNPSSVANMVVQHSWTGADVAGQRYESKGVHLHCHTYRVVHNNAMECVRKQLIILYWIIVKATSHHEE